MMHLVQLKGMMAEWFKATILKIVAFDENAESSNLSHTVPY